MNRIDRLTAILVQLQSKRVVKAEEIADRFGISLRTVYRDVKALMEGGVPIGSEAGKGYFIVEGYHLPPVMFTQEEAGAMLLAGKLVEKMTDKSVRSAFDSSLLKIKAVLSESGKDHLEDLHAHIEVFRRTSEVEDFPNHFLTNIQRAVVAKEVMRLDYLSVNDQPTRRDVEPIGLFFYSGAWHLIAFCRLRNAYRDFRTDRIRNLSTSGIKFDARNLLSLQEYLASLMKGNCEVEEVVIQFDASVTGKVRHMKYYYGFVSEEAVGSKVKMHFLSASLPAFCRWILTFGRSAEIIHPEEAREIMVELVDELSSHYVGQRLPVA
jgi:predicted DNA-binding transcriptional regulator YafY